MTDPPRSEYVERLAKLAAELAGQDPDKRLTLKLGKVVAFDDLMWRYPDFLARGEAAYDALVRPHLASPIDQPRPSEPPETETG